MSLRASGPARWGLAVLLIAVAIGAASARIGLLQQAGEVRLSADWVLTDFYSAAYYPVRAVLEGETPYARDSTYPPYAPLHLLIHLPFALLPPDAAGVAYFVFTILLTFALAYLALRLVRLTPRSDQVVLVAALILLSRPGHWTLLLGQVSILLTVATYLVLLEKGQAWRGVALATALLKPTFGLPLALLLLAWGRVRPAVAGIVLAALVNLPMLALLAVREGGIVPLFGATIGGYRSWQEIPDVNPATSNTRTDVASFVSRFVGVPISDQAQMVVSLGILVVAAACLRQLARHRTPQAGELAVAIICLAMSLIGFHRAYDLVLLTAPFIAVLVRGAPPGAPAWSRPLLAVLFGVPAVNWLATESALAAWQPSQRAWLLITSANTACLLILLLAYLWFALRYDRLVETTGARADDQAAKPSEPTGPRQIVARGQA